MIPALVLALVFLASGSASAQDHVAGTVTIPDRWLQGFSRAVAGELLVYPWAYPGQSRALLTRATDGRMRVEWEGEPLPPGVSDERVTYLWHAGMASGHGAHRFSLTVNGRPCATFTSGRDTGDREWTIGGTDGCSLAFKTTRVGTFNELFGLMLVTLPRAAVAGAPPVFAVVGEAAGNSDYYMTFQEAAKSWATATTEEARFKNGARVVSVEVSRIGDPARMAVRAGLETVWSGTAATGYTAALVPLQGTGTEVALTVEIDGAPALAQRVALSPVRAWEIHLLPHSHVDIGYSDPQPVVEQKQWKNLADAVRLAAATRDYPADARFKWNVEGLWAVESYLRQASEADRRAFAEAVAAGAIDLQANYTNVLTGISTPEELARWTDGARRLQQQYGFGPMPTAMHTDIPGLSWTVVRALAQAGVRYFSSGPNYMPGSPDGGDRIGQTLKALGDRPFWWQSPSGDERLLFWMAGRGYSWFHGMNLGQLESAGRQAFLQYLRQLQAEGYPYDMVQVRYTIGGDNGPVDPKLPDFVKAWNETFDAPRLVIDTARGLFGEFERRHGARLPTYAGDMTPYWEDGAISSAGEEALVRAAARRLQQAETLWALRNPSRYPAEDFGNAWRDVTMWHEHTWGAADSISQPDRKDVVEQWRYKREFALKADTRSRELLDAARATAGNAIEIINTASWPRDELVVLDAKDTGRLDRVLAGRRTLPSQRLVDGRLAVWTADVPALAALRLRFVPGKAARPVEPAKAEPLSLANGRLRVVVDPRTGDIRSLSSAGLPGIEFAGAPGLNGFRYVPGLDPAAAQASGPATVIIEEAGPLVATLRIESTAPGTTRLVRRLTLVAGDDRLYLEAAIDKEKVRQKESAHVAFPFNLPSPLVRVDEGEALVTIGKDQLPGSCRDFIGPHSAVDVSSGRAGVSLVTLDAPLVEIGAMTDERRAGSQPRTWRQDAVPGGTVFAYLLNNYWHTNYKADQDGELRFRFIVRPHAEFDAGALRRLGASADAPLIASRVPAQEPVTPAPFQLDHSPAIVSSLRPLEGNRGLLVRLYNPTGSVVAARLDHLWRGRVVTVVSPGERRVLANETIDLKPFGSAVLEITRTDADGVTRRPLPPRKPRSRR